MLPNGFYRDLSGVDPAELEVVCYGMVRSGSTLVFQLVSGLFPFGVAKTHRYCEHRVRTVASYRDFRDITVSLWRAADPARSGRRMTSDEVDEYAQRCARNAEVLDRYCEREEVCRLKYEEFFSNPRLIFESLRARFGIEVPERGMTELIGNYSLSANRRRADELKVFSRHDPATQIHGNHIHSGEPGTWQKFVQPADQGRLHSLLAPWLSRYGYT